MNRKKVLAVALLATMLTVGIVFGLTLVTSNHLTGTSGTAPAVTLTGNTTGTTYIGDTFHLVATLTNWPSNPGGVLVTFYVNGATIGGVVTSGDSASLDYNVSVASWNIYATANY